MKELRVAPKSNPEAVVAIMDDDEWGTGRFMATIAAASLTKENGEEYIVIPFDTNEKKDVVK